MCLLSNSCILCHYLCISKGFLKQNMSFFCIKSSWFCYSFCQAESLSLSLFFLWETLTVDICVRLVLNSWFSCFRLLSIWYYRLTLHCDTSTGTFLRMELWESIIGVRVALKYIYILCKVACKELGWPLILKLMGS